MNKLTVEWSTGPNITGHYTGTEEVTFEDNEEFNAYEWEEKLLKIAARKLCWDGRLKLVSSVITRV